MVIRQHFDPVSSTYSYLLIDPASRDAVLIDPVLEQHRRDAALIRELGVRLLFTLETHCHADHVTGAWRMKQAFGSRIGLAAAYGATNVDLPLAHGMVVQFGESALEVRATPGHTAGCLSFLSTDHHCVFTGDALLVRAVGRTDFQQGNAAQLFESVRTQLFTLPGTCVVYPAHDYEGRTSSTIGEERLFNPRLGGEAKQEDFVGYMENLGLPHPKLIAVALPANMSCGRDAEASEPTPPSWGPVVESYAGVPGDPSRVVEPTPRRGGAGGRPVARRVRGRARASRGSKAASPRGAPGPDGRARGVPAHRRHLPDREAVGDGGDHPPQGRPSASGEPGRGDDPLAQARAPELGDMRASQGGNDR